MSDPTYEQDKIEANPGWHLAWSISEIVNDNAPIGWGRYIYLAKCLLNNWDIKRKTGTESMSATPMSEQQFGKVNEVVFIEVLPGDRIEENQEFIALAPSDISYPLIRVRPDTEAADG